MKNLRNYLPVIALILIIIVAVLIRTIGQGHFRNDAGKWTGPSINQSNIITHPMLNTLPGNTLMVDLSDGGELLTERKGEINIPSASILEKQNLKKLRAHKGNILLASENPAIAARIWMLLSQMGFEHVYILSYGESNEVLKYEFRPDTLTLPES